MAPVALCPQHVYDRIPLKHQYTEVLHTTNFVIVSSEFRDVTRNPNLPASHFVPGSPGFNASGQIIWPEEPCLIGQMAGNSASGRGRRQVTV